MRPERPVRVLPGAMRLRTALFNIGNQNGEVFMAKKHLTLNERQSIELMLNEKKKFIDIATALGKGKNTISREIKIHSQKIRTGGQGFCYNNCIKRMTCTKAHICIPCKRDRKQKLCRRCSICNQYCSDYEPEQCAKLLKPPYVCNGCGMKPFCSLEKTVYFAARADQQYRELLSESRSGISYTEEELASIDQLISPLLKQNQSPHHIYATNKDSIMVSERTIYNLVNASLISARNLDLPRKIKYKPRKRKKYFKVDKACRFGRDYQCFLKYMQENPDTPITELDSVEGKKGGKVLLTIHFVKCEMMFAFLRDSNTAQTVIDVFNAIQAGIGLKGFQEVFLLLLADNGSEFSDPRAIEFDADGNRRTRMFYCDPSAPFQRGSAERNHEFLRYFIPKGSDFNLYSQDDITLMMNHINSYARASLGNKTPYETFRFFYGDALLKQLNCILIPPGDVTLNKSIFRKESLS